MERRDYIRPMRELLALEYNCAPEAFTKEETILTTGALLPGRRMYSDKVPFFKMVTTGQNAVISADPCLHPFLETYTRGKPGFWLFEIPNLRAIEMELNRFSYTLDQTHHMFLPGGEAKVCREFPVRWYYEEQIHQFYGDARFPNAICAEFLPQRPDRMAVVALDGQEIMGMAGCSEDAPGWLQIGIDVMPQYRSKGVATYLVALLKNKIQELGMIPFYGTSVSNYHSWNIAINCGFRPAWVELRAKSMK